MTTGLRGLKEQDREFQARHIEGLFHQVGGEGAYLLVFWRSKLQ